MAETTAAALNASEQAELVTLLSMARPAPEPGDLETGALLDGSTKDLAAGITSVTSSNHIRLYHTEDGHYADVPNNLRESVLTKRLESGKRAYLPYPTIEPVLGHSPCHLHPSHPKRAIYTAAIPGLKTCTRDNCLNEFEAERHMETRHKAEWAAIQRYEQRTREEEQRAYEREQNQAMLAALHGMNATPAAVATAMDPQMAAALTKKAPKHPPEFYRAIGAKGGRRKQENRQAAVAEE